MSTICIWKSIIMFNWELSVWLCNCINIHWWCGVQKLEIFISLVETRYELINVHEVDDSILVPKVIPHRHHYMIWSIVRSHMLGPFIHSGRSVINVVSFQSRVIHNRLVCALLWFPTESWGLSVMIKHHMHKYSIITKSISLKWLPYPFHRLLFHAFEFIFIINSCKEYSIKS